MSESSLNSPKEGKSHIEILDFLRGIAALSVVFFHFSGSTIITLRPNYLADFFSWGKLGVQVFFVISGFIIPYAMYSSRYQIKNAGNFLLKRIVRIGPPSWIAILLVFGLYYAAIAIKGKPIDQMTWPGVSPSVILSNLTYTCNIFGEGKYIDVYWTLEVEFQFYLVIALLLPLIIKYAQKPVVLSIILLTINASFLFHPDKFLFFRDNSFFILGILLFLYKTNQIKRDYFIYASMAAMILCYAEQGLPNSSAGIIAFMIIAFVKFKNSVTTFLGMISYSLYITHCFTGVMAEFVLRYFTGTNANPVVKVIMLFVYVGIAVFAAWVFYLLFEKTFIRLSQRVGRKSNK